MENNDPPSSATTRRRRPVHHHSEAEAEEPTHHGTTTVPNLRHAHQARVEKFLRETKLPLLEESLPQFSLSEIKMGDYLGCGSFGIVHEIIRIKLEQQQQPSRSNEEEEEASRLFLAQHCLRDNGGPRYAVKQLKEDNNPMFSRTRPSSTAACWSSAVADLLIEANFLRRLQHPHLVKLRAVSHADPYHNNSLQPRDYFLVLDKLYGTLATKLQEWGRLQKQQKQQRGRFLFSWFPTNNNKKQTDDTMNVRLVAAYHLSAGLKYLHDRKVVHRDIKPENIGFDIRGDLKIFDFGLARELVPSDAVGDGTYRLTLNTGTMRFMAPEVYIRSYNCQADVYSFGVLFWYMLTLKKPYLKQEKNFIEQVVRGGVRPKIHRKWPESVRLVLENSWRPNPFDRLNMGQIKTILHDEIYHKVEGGESAEDILNTSRRRSTFVLGRRSRTKSERSQTQSSFSG